MKNKLPKEAYGGVHGKDYVPYITDKSKKGANIAVMMIGIILAIIFAASTAYSGMKSGLTVAAGIPGAIKAVWISVGCRILIGVAAGWLWILFSKLKVNSIIALPIVGFAGAMVNTITVMGSIYILFAKQYAEAKDVAVSAVWGLVMGTVTASGIPEAIAAAILVLAIGKVLIGVFRKMNIGNV